MKQYFLLAMRFILIGMCAAGMLVGCTAAEKDQNTDYTDNSEHTEAEAEPVASVESEDTAATEDVYGTEEIAGIKSETGIMEGETGPQSQTDWPTLEEPPLMTVTCQDTVQSCRAGGYQWFHLVKGDEWVGIAADSLHPLDSTFIAPAIYYTDDTGMADIQFSFEVPPEKVMVKFWDGKYRGDVNSYDSQSVLYEAEAIEGEAGAYKISVPGNQLGVFQIVAEWKQDRFYGDAYYTFLAGPSRLFMDILEADEEGITVVFQNHTEDSYSYGEPYSLEKWQDGKWVQVPYVVDEIAYHDIAYVITAGGMDIRRIEYQSLYGSLTPGRYRVLKEVLQEKTADMSANAMLELNAEFTMGAEFLE